ncbi:MAG: hypothetical protein LBE36_14020 [Flavobacteriaceae bacterium]|jgi:hypothetical protein|nr:hypothetical protein [Flavobacteriaceae bacterium]
MQNLQKTQNGIFSECMEIIENLSKINTKDELLQNRNLIYQLAENVSFLKISENIDPFDFIQGDNSNLGTKNPKLTPQDEYEEKKFKLANIKGLKALEDFFDDDDETSETETKKSGSLLKTNVSTDFMEAEKAKPELRLDLNDSVAFSKMLFGGNQTELNNAIKTINQFKTLDETKEFLSELYHQKNWKNADEYAQRLWILAENRFL